MKHKIYLDDARTNESTGLEGRRIEITGASSKNALVELRVVYPNGHVREWYDYKRDYWSKSAARFNDVILKNTAQAGEWVEIEVTEHDENWIYSPREEFSLADAVEIDDTTPVKVDDDATQTALAALETDVEAIVTLLQNDEDQRAALTTLAGASHARVTGTSSTVVSAGANLNGVTIRHASLAAYSSSTASVSVGGNNLIEGFAWNAPVVHRVSDIFVPAGVAIAIAAGSSNTVNIWYEVH